MVVENAQDRRFFGLIFCQICDKIYKISVKRFQIFANQKRYTFLKRMVREIGDCDQDAKGSNS